MSTRRRKVTLKQLAKELNLSISTVSKSLKNDSEISQKTIDRVQELAKFYNYKPNVLAVSLKSNKTKNIGIIIPNILNPFFARVLLGIEETASQNGYKIVTCFTNESYDKEVEYLDLLSYSGVDGFILAVSEETQVKGITDHFEEIIKDDIPIVMFDRVADSVYCDKVVVDDKKGAVKGLKELIKSGCKNIAVISTISALSVGKLRKEGIFEVAKKQEDIKVTGLDLKKTSKAEVMIERFITDNGIDGVLALDEVAALTTLAVCKKVDKKVPEDVAIIGFSDAVTAKLSYPKLTTISQHAKKLGRVAAETLIDKLELRAKQYLPRTEIIKTTLVRRESSRPS